MIILRILALIIVWGLWLVIGPLLWIPLLVRSFAFVTFNLMAAVVTGASMAPAQVSLDMALTLYGRGFRAAMTILDTNTITGGQALPQASGYGRLVGELVYVVLFWLATIALVMMLIGISPFSWWQSRLQTSLKGDRQGSASETTAPAADIHQVPIHVAKAQGFVFKVYRCELKVSTIRCDLTAENQEQGERRLTLSVGGPRLDYDQLNSGCTLADDRGNQYVCDAGGVALRSQSGCAGRPDACTVATIALPNVVIPIWVSFDDVDRAATVAKRLRIKFGTEDDQWAKLLEFRDIELTR